MLKRYDWASRKGGFISDRAIELSRHRVIEKQSHEGWIAHRHDRGFPQPI